MDEDGNWYCNKCGGCCADIGWVYPELTVDGHRCKHLQDDMTCEIYEDRPDYCKVSNFPKQDPVMFARSCSWQRKRNVTKNAG